MARVGGPAAVRTGCLSGASGITSNDGRTHRGARLSFGRKGWLPTPDPSPGFAKESYDFYSQFTPVSVYKDLAIGALDRGWMYLYICRGCQS